MVGRISELVNKRVVLNYKGKVAVNDQQGIITHVGESKLSFNVGRKEIFIEKKNVNYAANADGSILWVNKKQI
jgi:hypothetical protein